MNPAELCRDIIDWLRKGSFRQEVKAQSLG